VRAKHTFVPDATSAVMVTRERPLPRDQVRAGLDWSQSHRAPIATLGDSERAL
jgi:hypothetical protein